MLPQRVTCNLKITIYYNSCGFGLTDANEMTYLLSKQQFIYTVYNPNLGWQLECFCILYTFHGKSSASVPCKRKRCRVQSVNIQATTCPIHGKATENAL